MRSISMDLRERVVNALGSGSSYAVAARFEVSSAWVRKIWGRLRSTGKVAAYQRGHRPRKVDAEGERLVMQWVAGQPDMTIVEVMARYLSERGVVVSEPAMRRTLKRLGLSRKKRHFLRQSGKVNASLPHASSTLRAGSHGGTDE